MELIVDTNILFSFFWKNSITKKILMDQKMLFFAPEFALEEIKKYENEIIGKTGLLNEEFESSRFDLAIAVEFLPVSYYAEFLAPALKISPDENDIDFIALALKRSTTLWSNDALLKKQQKVKILTTKEVLGKWIMED